MMPRLKKYTYSKYYFSIAKLNASGVFWKKKQLNVTTEE